MFYITRKAPQWREVDRNLQVGFCEPGDGLSL